MVDSHRSRSGELTDDDWTKLAHASSQLSECDIFIDDTTGIGATAMKAKLRRVKNLGLVVIRLPPAHAERQADRQQSTGGRGYIAKSEDSREGASGAAYMLRAALKKPGVENG